MQTPENDFSADGPGRRRSETPFNPMRHQSTQSSTPNQPGDRLVSQFAGDADMAELIEYFVDELQERITAMERAMQDNNRSDLYTLAHQLKGAAAGYGFPSITDSAAVLENTLRSDEAQLSAVAEKTEALINLCRQATGDTSRTSNNSSARRAA